MVPGYDCAASVLLCAEDNAAILGLDEEGEESSWAAAATPPRDTVAAAGATVVAVDGFLTELPLLSDECVAALVEREVEHMAAEGYPQKLQRRHGDLDLAAVRKDAVDWIWKVIEHYNFAPLTAVLSVNYLDRFLSTYELPEGRAWMTQLLAVACVSLASKMEETFVPLPLDLQAAETKFVFEGRTINRMELHVLKTLKWRMHAVTACSFVEHFLLKLSDHGAPSLLACSRSYDLVLSTAKGVEFVVFRPSEIAASVALSAMGECRSSVIERAASSCKYLNKDFSFYNGIGIELEGAHAGGDAILKDDLIIIGGTHGYGKDFILIDDWHSSLCSESYKVALGHNMALPTLANKRMETLAAISSQSTGPGIHLVLDSGASSHVVGDISLLQGYQPLANPRKGRQPDNSLVSIVGVGTIQTEHFSITNVFYVEGLGINLISASQLDQNYGMCSWFARGQCGVMLPDGTTAGEGTLENGVYVLSKLYVPAGPVMEASSSS